MKHRFLKCLLLTIILISGTGCMGARTEQLIAFIDPEGMVVVAKEDGDKIVKNLPENTYVRLNSGNYLVHKSKMRKFTDYTIISATAPVTMTIDSAMYVIEGIAKAIQLHNEKPPQEKDPTNIGADILRQILNGMFKKI